MMASSHECYQETVYPRICPGRFLALDVAQAIVSLSLTSVALPVFLSSGGAVSRGIHSLESQHAGLCFDAGNAPCHLLSHYVRHTTGSTR